MRVSRNRRKNLFKQSWGGAPWLPTSPKETRRGAPQHPPAASRFPASHGRRLKTIPAKLGRRTLKTASVLSQFLHGAEGVVHLREDGVFEDGLVGDVGVHGGDTAHGGVELGEQFVGDAGGDFSAVA